MLPQLLLFEGLLEVMKRGIFSPLQPQNTRLCQANRNFGAVAADRLYPALFDPQTAGGHLSRSAQRRRLCRCGHHRRN
jgi:selenide,water dikinase